MDDHEQAGAPMELTAQSLASRELTDYGMAERLIWLRDYKESGFVPTSRDEANDAFWIIYNAAKSGQTTGEGMERIHMSSHLRATTSDTLAKAGSSAGAVAQRQAAYARQASRDGRWLKTTQAQLPSDSAGLSLYPNAAVYFAGTPLYEGSGQIVRCLDSQDMIESSRDHDEFALRAQLDDRKKHITDSYTAPQPTRTMSEHVTAVLEAVSMDDLIGHVEAAIANEDRRLAFWTGQLVEMLPSSATRLIAQAALEDVR